MEGVLSLRDFSNMRLPQELLLWGQMPDMLQVPLVLLGTGWDCKEHFPEHKPVVGSVAVGCAPGKGHEQPVSKEGWRSLLSVSFRLGRSRCLVQQQKGT